MVLSLCVYVRSVGLYLLFSVANGIVGVECFFFVCVKLGYMCMRMCLGPGGGEGRGRGCWCVEGGHSDETLLDIYVYMVYIMYNQDVQEFRFHFATNMAEI